MNERPPKRIKMERHSVRETTSQLPIAPGIAEFLQHPGLYAPQLEFVDDFYVEDDTALIMAIKGLHVVAVASLLKAGSNPNTASKKGVTPISAAAHKGDVDIIHLLLDAGANVNAVNTSGSTALIQASHFGHLEAVLLLLSHGSEADFANPKGTTALMRASQEGYVEITKVLIAAQCDVNRKNLEGMNALMLASQRGHDRVVLELIKAGASMDEQTTQGSTALMLSCKRGHEKVVEVLVARGAEIYMRDYRARTARDTAIRRHHLKLLRHLNTQVQVMWISEHLRAERTILLKKMRAACNSNNLRCNPDVAILDTIVSAIKKSARVDAEAVSLVTLTDLAESTAASFRSTSLPTGHVSRLIANGNAGDVCRNVAMSMARPSAASPLPDCMDPKRRLYHDWQWPMLLMRCLHLPLGLTEIILDFLPTPRVWKWSLVRLKKRITLAPHAATIDISFILDEMFTDMTLFRGPTQRVHLSNIAKNEAIQQSLTRDFRMHPAMVAELVRWSDVQSLSFRASEIDVTFRSNLAKRYLVLAVGMYRLVKATSDPSHLFALTTSSSSSVPKVGASTTTTTSSASAEVKVNGQSGGTAWGESCQGHGRSDRGSSSEGDFQSFSLARAGSSVSANAGLPVLHPGIPTIHAESGGVMRADVSAEAMPDNTVILEMGDDDLNDTESELLAEADVTEAPNYVESDDEN